MVSVFGLIALAAGVPSVAAQPPATQSPKTASDPQSLSAELTAELQLVYRDNLPEITRRREQLQQATDAWNASAKNEADRAQMTAWLHGAIRASMPGSDKLLPPIPKFVVAEKAAKPAQPIAPSAPQSDLVAKPAPLPSPPVTAPSTETSLLKAIAPKETKPQQPAADKRPADGDPFQDDTAPDHADTRSVPAAPINSHTSPAAHSTEQPVHIRLDQLAPRVQGYEMALRGIDAKLIAGKLSTAALVDLSAKLDQLSEERNFLSLYVDVLGPDEQSHLPPLRSTESAIRLLAQRVEERQGELQAAGTSGDNRSRDEERNTLDELAGKLKKSLREDTPAN
ncbi:MAG TPA: hypothetical protein VGJ26_22555 [Pirellulales bacterium]